MSPVHEPLPPNVSFPALEEQVLARWRERDVFRATLRNREGGPPFVFYEGPPTANGYPGSHHVLTRVFKDVFPRYKTMSGHYVDAQGAAGTRTGCRSRSRSSRSSASSPRSDIERYGIAEFNRQCLEAVLEHLSDWQRADRADRASGSTWTTPTTRSSRATSSRVWWALKTMCERDLLYEGHKVVP